MGKLRLRGCQKIEIHGTILIKEIMMCFSAEASYTAAGALALIGAATLKKFSSHHFIFLALIPLMFALQQLSEGILWTQFNLGEQENSISFLAEGGFLIFAFFVWPIWIPLSLAIVEKVALRRNVLYFILACGVILSISNLYFGLTHAIHVNIIQHSIHYSGRVPPQEIIYPLIVMLPMFVSSLNKVWIFGILTLMGYIVANYFYTETFVSVWCFFAGIVSLILYKVLKDNSEFISLNVE